MSEEQPWLSVITVVKDDLEGFNRTLASLSEQELTDVEFVVIDSSTNPEEISQSLITHSSLQVRYEWSEPRGIYAAMNLGLARANGRFIYFANAGDEFFEPNVLANVRKAIDLDSVLWGFGPVQIVEVNGFSVITPSWDYNREKANAFSGGHFPAHQGTFVRTKLLQQIGGFSHDYSIVADYAAFLCFSQVAEPVVLSFPVARFFEGGVSTQRWKESFHQFHHARRSILKPTGVRGLKEFFNTYRMYLMVLMSRELKSRLPF